MKMHFNCYLKVILIFFKKKFYGKAVIFESDKTEIMNYLKLKAYEKDITNARTHVRDNSSAYCAKINRSY